MGGTHGQVASQDRPHHRPPANPASKETAPTSSTKPGAPLPSAVSCGRGHPNLHPSRTRSPVSLHRERWVGDGGRDTVPCPQDEPGLGSAVAGLAGTRWHQCCSAMPTGVLWQDATARCQPHHRATARCQPCHCIRERCQPRQGCWTLRAQSWPWCACWQ